MGTNIILFVLFAAMAALVAEIYRDEQSHSN